MPEEETQETEGRAGAGDEQLEPEDSQRCQPVTPACVCPDGPKELAVQEDDDQGDAGRHQQETRP